jgi:hypothetical protein
VPLGTQSVCTPGVQDMPSLFSGRFSYYVLFMF